MAGKLPTHAEASQILSATTGSNTEVARGWSRSWARQQGDGVNRWIGRPLLVFGLILNFAVGATPNGALADSSWPSRSEKISPELLALHEAYREAQRSGARLRFDNPILRIVEDRVLIDAAAAADVRALEADLVALGMRHAAVFGRLVSGELPIAAIPVLGALGSLAFARPSAASLSPGPGAPPRGP